MTLDDEGRVSDIRVSQSCGVDFLDEEAVAAFERAQPFPNPPTGLFDEDRHVRFRFGGTYVGAKKGGLVSDAAVPALRQRSWRLQTALVFQSPLASQMVLDTTSSSSNKLSMPPSSRNSQTS